MLGTLYVETDWDFSLEINGKIYGDMEFSVDIPSIEILNSIRQLGPHGSIREGIKYYEINNALYAIKKFPEEKFSNIGGNRGMIWYPKVKVEEKNSRNNEW